MTDSIALPNNALPIRKIRKDYTKFYLQKSAKTYAERQHRPTASSPLSQLAQNLNLSPELN